MGPLGHSVNLLKSTCFMGFSGGSAVKNPAANAGDAGSIPGSGRSPGEENGNPSPPHAHTSAYKLMKSE